MSYLVLARKYRPAGFADIVGQAHVVRTLANAIEMGRVHHAFLFTGARGVGKTTTARVLARALNCDVGPTTEPCGACPSCKEIGQGSSNDVLEIDGASNTSVDNVRDLRENVCYLPSRGRCKVYIIDEVHMLSQAAFNALLKTLEEPPAHVKFIFATTEPHKIPVTILSRCQRFDFRRVPTPVLQEHVRKVLAQEGVVMSPAGLSTIVREAQGSVRDALSLTDQVLSYTGGKLDDGAVIEALGAVDRQTIFDLCEAVLLRDASAVLRIVSEIDTRGYDLSDVVGLFVEHLRDVMVVKVVERPSESLLDRSPGEIEALRDQAALRERADFHRLFGQAVSLAEDVVRSGFPRVSLEMGLLRLVEIEPSASLADLLGRVDALLRGAPSPSSLSRPPASAAELQPTPQHVLAPVPALASPPIAASDAQSCQATHAPPDTSLVLASAPDEKSAGVSGSTVSDVPSSTSANDHGDGNATSQPAVLQQSDVCPTSEGNRGWQSLVQRLRETKPMLASWLEHGRLVAYGPMGVEVGFKTGAFYLEAVRETDNRQAIIDALSEQFGQPVQLTLSALAHDVEVGEASLAEQSQLQEEAHRDEVREEALNHPAVRGALDIMGGEVASIRSLEDGGQNLSPKT